LKAYERWQFASLADEGVEPAAGPTPSDAAVSAHELAVLRETARADGHTAGFAAGRAEGLAAAAAEAEHLRRLTAAVGSAFKEFNQETAEALLGLALDTARHVLRVELASHAESMLPALREAIDLAGGGMHPQLLLNPGDMGFVQRHLGEELTPGGWRLTEDPRIEPGGCRVVTSNGAIDATLATRWQRTVAALGRDDAWRAGEALPGVAAAIGMDSMAPAPDGKV
jgi:flagellar assembly protein FliH